MDLYTVQLSQWRIVSKLGIPLLNTTVKSGIKAFAPSWEIVMDVKRGIITPEQYTDIYHELMEQSLQQQPAVWEETLALEQVAIACYCRPGLFCHRHLLAKLFERECAKRSIRCVVRGEITPESAKVMEGP